MVLYHASNWELLAEAKVGQEFTLLPGPQGAEGRGVYFAEGLPRPSAADGLRGEAPQAIVAITAPDETGWWRTKAGIARKFGRPRSWHSDGKAVTCRVVKRESTPSGLVLHCEWSWG